MWQQAGPFYRLASSTAQNSPHCPHFPRSLYLPEISYLISIFSLQKQLSLGYNRVAQLGQI